MKLREHPKWKKDLLTDDSGTIWRVHKRETCNGSNCAIHNPSDHPLKDARIVLRWPDPFSLKPTGFVERVCEHGVGHSDPDSVNFYENLGIDGTSMHGCCAEQCCISDFDKIIHERRAKMFDPQDWAPEDECEEEN